MDLKEKIDEVGRNTKEGQGYYGVMIDELSVAVVGFGRTSNTERALVVLTLRALANKMEKDIILSGGQL